jgi:hypothetical protein
LTTIVQSPNYYEGRVAPVRVVVVHTGETPESDTAAEGMANWFSRTTTRASAHLCVDLDSTVRCVDDEDTAWAAPGANADGLQIELAGRAGQTSGDWADKESATILTRAAAEVAVWCIKYRIPARWLTDKELADGKTMGLTTHVQVSRVFKRSDHWDPGPNFPSELFLKMVVDFMPKAPVQPVPIQPKPAKIIVPAYPGLVRRGHRGKAVLAVQRRLKERGWRITQDGIFGPGTESVVKAFQKEKRLTADGIVGPITWRKLWTAPGAIKR